MQNNSICTSVEQSQRLIGLGLDADTADLHYILRKNSEPRLALLAFKVSEGTPRMVVICADKSIAAIHQCREYRLLPDDDVRQSGILESK